MIIDKNLGKHLISFVLIAMSVIPSIVLAEIKPLQIGVLPTLSVRGVIKNYQPLQIYLERELKRAVELTTTTDFRSFHQNTMEGKYDLVVTAAHMARLAQTQAGFIPLAKYQAKHRTLLIVAKDQPLKSVQDLRGKVLASIDPHALVVSQTLHWLREQGLRPGIDFTLLETPSTVSAAHSVQSHQSVMGITSPQGLKQIPDSIKDYIEVFVALPELPSLMWLVNPRIANIPRLKAVLFAFPSSPEGVRFFEATGHIGLSDVTVDEMKSLDPYAQEISEAFRGKK